MLGDLKGQLVASIVGCQGVENGWEFLGVELDVDDGSAGKSAIASHAAGV